MMILKFFKVFFLLFKLVSCQIFTKQDQFLQTKKRIAQKTKGLPKLMKGVDCMWNKLLLVVHTHTASCGTHF